MIVSMPGPVRDYLIESSLCAGAKNHGYGPAGDELGDALLTRAERRQRGRGFTYTLEISAEALAVAVDYIETMVECNADSDSEDPDVRRESAAGRRFLDRAAELTRGEA